MKKRLLVVLTALVCALLCAAPAALAAEDFVVVPGGKVPENNHPVTNETPVAANPHLAEERASAVLCGVAAGTAVLAVGYGTVRLVLERRKRHEAE